MEVLWNCSTFREGFQNHATQNWRWRDDVCVEEEKQGEEEEREKSEIQISKKVPEEKGETGYTHKR